MKTTSIITAGLAAFALAVSFNALAADDAATPAQQPEAKMQMKPHSHMEEKMGVVTRMAKAPAAKPAAAKRNPATDLSRHYHPRDGGK